MIQSMINLFLYGRETRDDNVRLTLYSTVSFFPMIQFQLNDPGFADSSIYDLETSNLEKSLKICHFEILKEPFSYHSLMRKNEPTLVVLHNSAVNMLASTEKTQKRCICLVFY